MRTLHLKKNIALLSFLLLCIFCSSAEAGNTATHSITINVAAVSDIHVSGEPGVLEVFTSAGSSTPVAAVDSSTSYSFFTNQKSRKITGVLDQNTPSSTFLRVNLKAPAGAVSQGDILLSTSPQDLVRGVGKKHGNNLPITYKFSANRDAGRVPLTTRTVTFTITGE